MSRRAFSHVLLLFVVFTWVTGDLAAKSVVRSTRSVHQDVVDAALDNYVHGMTAQIALEKVGPEGVPVLLQLLADPGFPRRDNVVAFLTYLGAGDATEALLGFLANPPAAVAVPEEDRALLLTPQAFGHIASRGEPRALQALMDMTAPGSMGGILASAASRSAKPAALRDDLLEMALRGLAFSGAPEAKARLARIANGEVIPVPEGRSLSRRGRAALELTKSPNGTLERDPDRARSRPLTTYDGEPDYFGNPDTNSISHDSGLDFANHPDVQNPMSDARLDTILKDGSLRAGRADFTEDVACCVSFSRLGSARVFGSPGDGKDSIDTSSELTSVLNDSSARVKVVRLINYCGGTGTNIIGCAWVGGDGMALVRMSNIGQEGALWLHEYGHNTGLSHNADNRYIMHGVLYSSTTRNIGVTQAECTRYHAPASGSHADLAEVGPCTDYDGDGVQDSIDNCPGVPNIDQLDTDQDGIGDACEQGCGNGIKEGEEECDTADLGGATCQSLNFDGGDLACNQDCTLDTTGCYDCGNGVKEGPEECDGADLGGATCQDDGCAGGTLVCNTDCSLDKSGCTGCPVCDSDGLCEPNEDCFDCPSDCISGSGVVCGNGICEAADGEDCLTCASDCAGTTKGKPDGRYCCGFNDGLDPAGCSAVACNSNGYQCIETPSKDYCCGDGSCEALETPYNCELDCGPPPACGDGQCNGSETVCSCPSDCGQPGAEICNDGIDNDCDQLADCSDSDCDSQPECQCGQVGDPCSANGDCCSFKCRGRSDSKTCR